MRFGFFEGIMVGYFLFTDEGKKMTKSVIEKLDQAGNKAIKSGKEIVEETFPETSKKIRGEEDV